MRRVLFWLPLLLWLGVEIYLLEVALSVSCRPQSGGNRMEVIEVMFFWGLPSSIGVTLISGVLPFGFCSTAGCVALWVLDCSAGFIQWYFVLEWLAKLSGRFRQRFR